MEELLKILNLSSSRDRIRVVANLDLTGLVLTPEEGFLLSRIDAVAIIEDIVRISPFSAKLTHEMLCSFAQRHLIESAVKSPPTSANVSEDFRKEIDMEYQRLSGGSLSPMEILHLSGSPTAKEIRDAYVKWTKKFHPDRLFRKGADDWRQKVNLIFQQMNQAFEALSESPKRPPPGKAREAPPVPLVSDVKKKAVELLAEAKKQKLKDPVKAHGTLKLAQSFDPSNTEIMELLREVEPRANLRRSVTIFEKAREYDEIFAYDKAREAYEFAANADPENADFQRACGEFLLYKSKEPQEAMKYATLALKKEPRNVQNILLMGYVLKGLNRAEEALTTFERAIHLDRGNLFAKTEIAALQREVSLSKKRR